MSECLQRYSVRTYSLRQMQNKTAITLAKIIYDLFSSRLQKVQNTINLFDSSL
jgi:hypothetical protein